MSQSSTLSTSTSTSSTQSRTATTSSQSLTATSLTSTTSIPMSPTTSASSTASSSTSSSLSSTWTSTSTSSQVLPSPLPAAREPGATGSVGAGLLVSVILCSLSLSGLLGLAIHLRKRRALGADLRDSPAPPSEEVEEADDDYDCEAVESDSKDRAPPFLNQAKLKSWVEEDMTMPSGSADDPLAAESPDIQDTPSDEGPVGGFAADSSIAAHDSPSEEDLAAMREDIGELKGSDQSFPDFIIEI
ncbi:hypothetical protein AK812_SmicGene21265 [Symbiodinium microadriaticum]|uniref:Uncharacterized protein n=1 Tax=Symbiodinium microadriaticum TaxID=2951 RepID=A0A1Q9DMW2_SYMMI|nr:hypothetical protein AK812_SmicGene21265 [Symbiodinium microadriaticum]